MSAIPSKVRHYFRARGSRRRFIWPLAIHADDGQGWRQVGWVRAESQRKMGPTQEGRSWPLTTTAAQYTDGEIRVDFTRRELMESEVAL